MSIEVLQEPQGFLEKFFIGRQKKNHISSSNAAKGRQVSLSRRPLRKDVTSTVPTNDVFRCRPGAVTPVDQFRWSPHVEIVGMFRRG